MADKEAPPVETDENNIQKPEPVKSRRDALDRDLVFYYSRERRLSRAPAAVQELNSGTVPKIKITNRLFGNRINLMLFIAILLICAVFGLSTQMTGTGRSAKLGRNTLTVGIMNEEGILMLDLEKKAPKGGGGYTGEVDIAVSPVMEKPREGETRELPEMFTHRIILTEKDNEFYRISIPFDGNDFLVLLRIDNDQKALKLKAVEGK